MTLRELLTTIEDSRNWTDEFLEENEDMIVQHYNDIRKHLGSQGAYIAFDRAFTERKRPGQVALMDSRDIRRTDTNLKNSNFDDIEYFEKPDINKLPAFKTEWLPRDYQLFADSLSECLQIAHDMAGIPLLIIASTAVQKKYQINPKSGWYEPLNLYAAVVAEPSERKSQTQRAVTEPLYQYEREENKRRQPDISEYQLKKKILKNRVENMTKAATNNRKKKEGDFIKDILEAQRELDELEEVAPLRLIADDITAEALIRLMEQNDERMSIISSEGGIFQIMAGLYSGDKSNIDIYLKAYSGDQYFSDRKLSGSSTLYHPSLSVLLFVQPGVIQEIMKNKEFRSRGLLARFLYAFPPSNIGKRNYRVPDVPDWVSDAYTMGIRELLEISVPDKPHLIHLSKVADMQAEIFYNEIEKQLPEDLEEIKDWAGKFHGQTMRIAGVLHCMKHGKKAADTELEGETMKNAIEMGRYFLEHAKAAFSIMGLMEGQSVKDGKYILKRLNSIYRFNPNIPKIPNNIKMQALWQKCRGHFQTREDMQPGLDELTERNYIRIKKQSTGKAGRPSEIIEINPVYLEKEENSNGSD